MKKLISIILAIALIIPAAAYADLPDISGLSFSELVQLKEQINMAIFKTDEWQEVTVPAGVWTIGIDIPAGHWTITPVDDQYMSIWYGDILNESGTDAGEGWDGVNGFHGTFSTKKKKNGSWKDPDYAHFVDIILKEGWYLITSGTVVISPYTGKPDLGFK